MTDFRHQFIAFAIEKQVLRFGEFVTKAGRPTPYFFNNRPVQRRRQPAPAGSILRESHPGSGLQFDMLFGPAYKGIPLVASIAISSPVRSRAQRAFLFQPQGSQGSWRRRLHRRCAAQGPCADRGRR